MISIRKYLDYNIENWIRNNGKYDKSRCGKNCICKSLTIIDLNNKDIIFLRDFVKITERKILKYVNIEK